MVSTNGNTGIIKRIFFPKLENSKCLACLTVENNFAAFFSRQPQLVTNWGQNRS